MQKAVTFETDAQGEPQVWVVWAVVPTVSPTLVAICSTEDRAERYRLAVEQNYPGARFHAESAPIDHVFGAVDLQSVAYRRAMREVTRRRAGE